MTTEIKGGVTPKTDKHGNVHGTTYTQEGVAMHDGKPHGTDRPQNEARSIMYEEDGTEFKMPEKHEETLAKYRMDLKGLEIAISGGKQKVETATALMDEADEADKPIFAKSIASQQAAIESNSKEHARISGEKKEFELSLITPAQRKDEREYQDILLQIQALTTRKSELENKRKAYGIGKNEVIDKKVSAAAEPKVASDEQKANYERLLALHTTQGAVVVALIKEGKTNAEVANYIGINPANVPGPKNKWLRGEGAKEGWFADETTGRVSKK